MDLRNYFDEIIARKEFLAGIIREKTKSLENAPAGNLRVANMRGHQRYYIVSEKGDTKGKYIRAKDIGQAKALAQRDYDQKIVKAAKKELYYLNGLIMLNDKCIEEIYPGLGSGRQNLVTPVELPDDEYIRRWLEGKRCTHMGFDENDPVILTREGYRVRSKSEQLWADTFYRMGVPYYFEPLLYLKGRGWVRPDFVGLNVRTRKEKYVEHLGMMDDIGYSNKNVSKAHDYERNGFVLGEDLLITMETRRHPPEARAIENLIRKHFL